MGFSPIITLAIIAILGIGWIEADQWDRGARCRKDDSLEVCVDAKMDEINYLVPGRDGGALVSILICKECDLTIDMAEYKRVFDDQISLFEADHSIINFKENIFQGIAVEVYSLIFRNCTFTGLEPSVLFNNNEKLKELIIEGFKVGHLKNQFHRMSSLEVLRLDNARIDTIDAQTFADTPNLQVLHLNYNILSSAEIRTPFKELTNLEELSLHGNRIMTVNPRMFPRNLKTLDISGNPIMELDFESFMRDHRLISTIKMHETPCFILGMLESDKSYHFIKKEDVNCKTRMYDSRRCNLLQLDKGWQGRIITVGETLIGKDEPAYWLDTIQDMDCINFRQVVADYEGVKPGLEQAAGEMILFGMKRLKSGMKLLDLHDGLSDAEHDLISNVQVEVPTLNRYQLLLENQITTDLED